MRRDRAGTVCCFVHKGAPPRPTGKLVALPREMGRAAAVPEGASADFAGRGLTRAMPFFDLQGRLGLDIDKWMTILSAEQPYKIPARCHAFEKEFIECAHGIGMTRAKKECKLELDDFIECLHRRKTIERLGQVMKRKEQLMKEGKYTPPDCHSGKDKPRP
uniref:NADH dehydrogenase [ubiquinone] iron-sulfur protein 5 n=1 Tax=Monodelphis domestica TaxID=13616 RepID=A0A5F8G4Y1_MONDO